MIWDQENHPLSPTHVLFYSGGCYFFFKLQNLVLSEICSSCISLGQPHPASCQICYSLALGKRQEPTMILVWGAAS